MPNPSIVPITQPRVPFLNPETGFVSMPWYRFLLSLSQLTGGSEVSLGDLQKGPPTLTVDEINLLIDRASAALGPSQDGLLDQLAELRKQIEGLALTPSFVIEGEPLTKTDDTNVTLVLGGTPDAALLVPVSLALGWNGQLSVARGGTGLTTTPTNGQLLIGNGTGYSVANLTAGTNVSITNGPGSIVINSSNPGGTVTSVGLSAPTGFAVGGSPVISSGTLALSFAAGYSLPTNASQTNWDTAFSERRQWDGGSTSLVPATGRTSLGATTVGSNLFTLANPSAIRYMRINADNSVSTLDAATFRTAIGAGTGDGTVTSVTGTSPVASSGGTTPAISLAAGYGDTQNPYASKTANFFLAAPNGAAGVPTFRAMVAADVPTLNQNTTGTAANVTGTVAIANGGTGATTAATARTALGATTVGANFFTLANPSAVTYTRINADNSVSTLDAATFRTAIGAGTGNGSVTSVATGTGLTGGPITGSGTVSFAVAAVGTWAATPSSANLAAAMTDETGSGPLVFGTRPSFTTTIGVGGATASASGSGVSFPATKSPSTDVNTLDDYEEGTFNCNFGTFLNISGSWGQANCTYTKIGRHVFVSATITGTGMGVNTNGYIQFIGMPFTVATNSAGSWGSTSISSQIAGTIVATGTEFWLYASNNNNTTNSIWLSFSFPV